MSQGPQGKDDRGSARWLEVLDRALGPAPDGAPTSGEIVAFAAGELDRARRGEVAAYLQQRPELLAAARAGIEELMRLRAADPTAGPWPTLAEIRDRLGGVFVGVLALQPARLRAAAASATAGRDQLAPVPEDRQVLLDEPGLLRLVYFRRGAAGQVALFDGRDRAAADRSDEPIVACQLDGVELAPEQTDQTMTRWSLGPVQQLCGKRLAIAITLAGEAPIELGWTLIDLPPATGAGA